MSTSDAIVVHAVASDTPAEKLDVLRVLCGRGEGPVAREIVHVGAGAFRGEGITPRVRVHTPLGLAWLGMPPISAVAAADRPQVVHVWSWRALAWAAPQFARGSHTCRAGGESRHLLVETDLSPDPRKPARWRSSLRNEVDVHFVCPTLIAQRRLLQAGAQSDETVVIREAADFGAVKRARGAVVRAELGLSPADTIVLVLPPVLRTSGAFCATWATLVLQQVRANVRLVVPGRGREVRRIGRLADSVRLREAARFDGGRFTPAELLSAADLAVYTPPADAPVTGLVWAMAAGVPIVASAVPAVAELLAHGHNAWLCHADDPKDIARRMLQALEQPAESRRHAETARAQAFKAFGRQRVVEQYRRAYANLLAGRKVGEQIRDSASIG
jgi:hypothetical protein